MMNITSAAIRVALSAVSCLGCAQARATSIVIIRTPKHIVVAADSLWTYQSGVHKLPPRIGCKIDGIGQMYFTGSTTNADGQQMQDLAWRAVAASRSLSEAAHRFILLSHEMVARTARSENQSVIDMCSHRVCAEAFFFGIEKKVPKVIAIQFEQVGRSRQSLLFKPHELVCPGRCPSRQQVFLYSGRTKAMNEVVRRNSKLLRRYADQDVARQLIKVEEEAEPAYVGGPIDVLMLDADGAHWTSGDRGTCSDH